MITILLDYDERGARGVFSTSGAQSSPIWIRLCASAADMDASATFLGGEISVQWRCALELLRLHAKLQSTLDFEFDATSRAEPRIRKFQEDVRTIRAASGTLTFPLAPTEIEAKLIEYGWDLERHRLKPYQLENLARLVSLSNGANFSVPGAGKTTVTFALHLLTGERAESLLVVAPRNAFLAWEEVVGECLLSSAPDEFKERFLPLTGGEARISQLLSSPRPRRYIISYDQLVRVELLIKELLTSRPTHLVLDESHRMKAGAGTRRGTVLLRVGHLAVRRDILSGTPMPQSSADLQSQMDFLWPGAGLGSRIATGEPPKGVIGGLYVRTTKQQLHLSPRVRTPVPVTLSSAHLAFYSMLKDDVRARASELRRGASGAAIARARRTVVHLLQAAVNPQLVAGSIRQFTSPDRDGLLRAVIEEGPSNRVKAAADLVSSLTTKNRKVLVWTIFTSTIGQLKALLDHLDPAVIYGGTANGDEDDDESRQGQIRRFKSDPNCMVMIANPAAASEGMSLHMHCHDAVYVDRSYNATHFLQSVDRIHRLGLPEDVTTTIYVLENKLPYGVGSIDLSVARRLAKKIRGMEQLLEDPDLNALALDEEGMEGALEDSISVEDIDDLISELENAAPHPEADDLV